MPAAVPVEQRRQPVSRALKMKKKRPGGWRVPLEVVLRNWPCPLPRSRQSQRHPLVIQEQAERQLRMPKRLRSQPMSGGQQLKVARLAAVLLWQWRKHHRPEAKVVVNWFHPRSL